MVPNLSWVKAQTGSINIPGVPSSVLRPSWFRDQTLLESGSVDGSKIISSIRLSSSSHALSLDVIKAAVRQLRFDHPAMASQVGSMAENSTPVFVYQAPDSESDIDEWLSRVVIDKTNVLLESGGDIDKVIETLTYELGTPLARPLFLVHYIPATSSDEKHALVFYLNHSVFDAIGSFQIMDLCVSRIAESLATGGTRNYLPWGEETSRLPPAHSVSAKIPYNAEKTPEDEIMVQRAKRCMEAMLTSHKLPIPHPHSPPSGTGLFTRIASADLVTSLRNAARAHGCTVFSVLWAAMVLSSIRIRSPDPSATKNITLPFIPSPVDLRYLACDDRYDRSQWKVRLSMGFHAYIAEDLARFRLAEDFWVLAKEAREQTQEQQKYYRENACGEGVGPLGDEATLPTKWYPILSSIGVMDKYLARFHPISNTGEQLIVSSARLSPTFNSPFLGGGLALHTFTWEGELMMAFTFPEGVMGTAQDQVKALKEGHKVDAIALEFVNEFMDILDVIARMN
ncbi:hypothetical protein BT96DRAFT_977647 [Gymnopus androsaceus JB14]|uniref:Alcohol acetyltransferase n=1 Tax=Gymnopus androsaceus JB14 TaxID=1447944 RepID=A0A6A4HCS1_9AGAR|nr:hypothetical protein BT96DRAFT_977647 [Gymnopus androsaceus JB14]